MRYISTGTEINGYFFKWSYVKGGFGKSTKNDKSHKRILRYPCSYVGMDVIAISILVYISILVL